MTSFSRVLPLLLLVACVPKGPEYTVKLNEQYGHLGNGVRVILLPDPTSSLVEVDVRYAVGSKEDPVGRAGLAHLVEHLLFLQRPAPGEPTLGAVLRQHSIGHNATTTWDYTHYMTLARSEELPAVLALEGMRLGNGCESLTQDILDREREVVLNELRMRLGNPEGQYYVRLHELLYPEGHPYHRVTGGTEAELRAVTVEDVCAFVRGHYVPERATVVIAGAFDEAVAQRALAERLGAVPARPAAPSVPVPPVKLAKRRVTVDTSDDESSVIVAWPMPPQFGKDSFAYPFIGDAIGSGAAVFSKIFERSDEVDWSIIGGPRAPILVVRMTIKKGGDADDAAGSVLSLSNRAHWGLQYTDVDGARARFLTGLAADLESLAGRAFTYASYAQFEPEQRFATQVELMKDLEPGQIKRVVRDTLGEDKAAVVKFKAKQGTGAAGGAATPKLPSGGDVDVDELPVDARAAGLSIELPRGSTSQVASARRFTLGNGLEVVLLPTQAPIPVVTARLTFGAGSGHEPTKRRGLATFAGVMLVSRLGNERVTFDVDVTPDTTEVSAHVASLWALDLIDGLKDLERPAYVSQSTLDAMHDRMQRLLKRRTVRSYSAMSQALGAAVYGADHPYASAFDPVVAARLKADDDEVEGFIKKHYRARNATLVVAGVFDAAEVEARIRAKLGGWASGKPDAPVTAPPARAAGPVAVGVAGDAAEPMVEVRVAYDASAGMDEGYAARLVLAQMLDRRVAAVRERMGASYGVSASYRPTVGPAIFGVAGAVDASRAGDALVAIREAIDGLRRGDGFLEDFVRARATVLSRVISETNSSQTLAARLSQLHTFGLPPDYPDRLASKVAHLAPHEVLKLARSGLDPTREVVVCEGPRPALESMFAQAKITAPSYVDANKPKK